MAEQAGDMKFADKALVLVGEVGMKLSVAPYTKGGQKRALILIEGIADSWNGKVLDHEINAGAADGENYVTQYDGKPWTSLAMRRSWGMGQYEAFVTDDGNGRRVWASDELAGQTHPQAIFRVYERQQNAGK